MLLSRTNTCKKYSLHASVERASSEHASARGRRPNGSHKFEAREVVSSSHATTSPMMSSGTIVFRSGQHSRACIRGLAFVGLHSLASPGSATSPARQDWRSDTIMRPSGANSHMFIRRTRIPSAISQRQALFCYAEVVAWRSLSRLHLVCCGGACSASGCYIDKLWRGRAIRGAGSVRLSTAPAMSLITAPRIAADLEFDLAP
jgi:hypothetical protein